MTCSTVHSLLTAGKLVCNQLITFKHATDNDFIHRTPTTDFTVKKTRIKFKTGATGTELSDKNKELCNSVMSLNVLRLSTGLCRHVPDQSSVSLLFVQAIHLTGLNALHLHYYLLFTTSDGTSDTMMVKWSDRMK